MADHIEESSSSPYELDHDPEDVDFVVPPEIVNFFLSLLALPDFDNTTVIKPPNLILKPGEVEVCSVRLLESRDHHGGGVCIGVARADIPDSGNLLYKSHGWFFNLNSSLTYSGAPQHFYAKEYGPRKGQGCYVRDGDVVGLVMDMVKGELSFIVNGENLGVAFSGIPTDEPLIPCVIYREAFECSVEFISRGELKY